MPRSRQIVWAAMLIGLLAAALALAFLAYAEREIRSQQRSAVEMQARVLEDQTSAVVAGTDTILRSLATVLAQQRPAQQAGGADALLADSLRGRPFLRSVSLVDEQGRVRASSNAENLRAVVPPAWLAAAADAQGRTRLLPVASGRDLDDLNRVPLGQARLLAMPMLAPLPGPADGWFVVALINPDHLATQFERMLEGSGLRALLLGLDAAFIVGTSDVAMAAGTSLRGLPAFERHLPQLEAATDIGPGADGQPALASFRATRAWPLVVLVEQRYQAWPQALRDVGWWTAGFLLSTWVLLAGAAWVARRSFRRDERLNHDLVEAHTATQASESRKLAILQSSLDAIVTVDSQGRVIEFNAAAERMFGYAAAQAVGRPMHELIVPAQHRAAHQAGMARYRATGEVRVMNRRIEIEALRADGTVFPVELTIVPVRTDAGEIFTATLRDITERRRVESALRDSEARANATFEQAAVGVLEQDFDQRLLRVNQTLCTMLGYTREELLSMRVGGIVHPQDFAAASEGFRALRSGEVAHFATDRRYRRKDGSYLWTRLTASPARGSDGRPTHLIGIVEDISARRQAEDALRDSQALLDKTGRIGGVGGWEYDVATGVVTSTAQSCRIHEIPTGTHGTLAQTLAFYAPEAQPVIGAAVQRCLELGEGFDVELPFVTARGRSIWVRALGTAEYRDGRVARLVGALQDVTERRRARKELLDARERELQVGARIQQSLLVTKPPADLAGLQISSYSQASQGIDGDFVEVIRVGDHCVDLIAGDVMGKGLAAAMMGAATKLQFSRSFAELLMAPGAAGQVPRPAEVVAAVHRAMTPALQALEAFVTLCYLRIDTRRHTITWVGCGHEETLCVGAGAARALANQHPPLGVLDGADYREDEQPVAPGELVFLCSDGVTDALRTDGERVGRDRVCDAVVRRAGLHATPGAVLHSLRADLLLQGVQMQDDVTMVVLQFPAAPVRRIELPATVAAIRRLREFVTAGTAAEALAEGKAGLLEVACVEAFTNIVRHAQGRPDGAPIEVVARREPGALVLELVHLGAAYTPPAEVPDTDFGVYPEGGFGLEIIRRASDEVAYLHEAGVNTVRMTCHLA